MKSKRFFVWLFMCVFVGLVWSCWISSSRWDEIEQYERGTNNFFKSGKWKLKSHSSSIYIRLIEKLLDIYCIIQPQKVCKYSLNFTVSHHDENDCRHHHICLIAIKLELSKYFHHKHLTKWIFKNTWRWFNVKNEV